MADDEKTRPARAVRRRPAASSIADVPTRKVQAVQRRAPASTPMPRGLLPREASTTRCFRFLETRGLLQSGFTTDRYDVSDDEGAVFLQVARSFSLFPGRRLELIDLEGNLRFSMIRRRRNLVLNDLDVYAPDELLLARFEQRFTGFEVKFDIFDTDGALRFHLFQPQEVATRFDVLVGETVVATIGKDSRPITDDVVEFLRFVDAFRVDLHSRHLDERDRVILLAAALFLDRVFFTGKNQ